MGRNCLCVKFWTPILVLIFVPVAPLTADYSSQVELLEYSTLSCGKRIRNKQVLLIDLQALLNDKKAAVSWVNKTAPNHGIESPIPILMEEVHLSGKVRRKALLRDAVRASASRGCDLVIVLDIEFVEKVMFRPLSMDLKLPVSYVLMLFGSQVRNSAPSVDK